MKIIETLKASWSSQDIRKRILITILLLVFFRALTLVPVPGINPNVLKDYFNSPAGAGLNFINIFSGGTFTNFSILSVGLIPFINASVIFQLLPTIIKRLEQMQKEGENGRKRLTQYTRLLTVPLAILTSVTIFITLKSQGLVNIEDPLRIVAVVSVLAGGSMFMMWLGEVITEKGIGNGVSLLIMIGILASLPEHLIKQLINFTGWTDYLRFLGTILTVVLVSCLYIYLLKVSKSIENTVLKLVSLALSIGIIGSSVAFLIAPGQILNFIVNDKVQSFSGLANDFLKSLPVQLGLVFGFAIVVIGIIVVFNEAARNLPIFFSRKAATASAVAKKSFMPLKLLQAGVMPIIFANALLLFPYTVSIIIQNTKVPVEWMQSASSAVRAFLEPQDFRYWALNFLFTAFFAYFYTFVLFRPQQVADQLKKSGSYIPGVRPGLETENFLRRTMLHLVFAGAIVLGIMSTTQAFVGGGGLGKQSTSSNSLLSTVFTSGTSLLIVVGVALDTRRQFNSYLAQRNYDDLFEDIDLIDTVPPKEKKKFFSRIPLVKRIISKKSKIQAAA